MELHAVDPIPEQFANYDDAADFWDTHDTTDYLDQFTTIEVTAMFDFNDYQTRSRKTWNLIHTDHPIVYPTLGLVNEAGELAGKVKKISATRAGSSARPIARRSSTSWATCSGTWPRLPPSWI